MPIEQASELMPCYSDGVEALLAAGGVAHSATRNQHPGDSGVSGAAG
ncbi:hypothetical protein ACFU7Y_00010 [Kitasatospora sp. NPDC057542]|nr:hypothetical protein [Streptomyces sp. LS1784]